MRTVLFSALAFVCMGLKAHAAPVWDIADTGQPFVDAEFTLTEGTFMSLDVSPDGKTIVFDLLGDIYALPAAGGDAKLVHGGPAIQRMPTFSRVGDRIAYISDASGNDNIWASAPDGSAARQVSREDVNLMSNPAWSADGRHVAATLLRAEFAKSKESEIRLYDVADGASRVAVPVPDNKRDITEAEFTPDGRFVYYTHRTSDPHIYVDANHDNYAIERRELNGGAVQPILRGFGGATSPQISPDGKRIAFVRRVKQKTVLFVFDTATGEQRPVYDNLDRDLQADFVPQGAYYPRFGWFPDNRHVAIWGKGKLYRIDTETGTVAEIPFRVQARHRITLPARFPQDLAPAHVRVRAIPDIAVTPDGKALVFHAVGHLWRQTLPAGTPQRLTTATVVESEPALSPDGKTVAYVTWDDEKGASLIVAAMDGDSLRVVATSRGPIRQPSFSRDGTRLVYRLEFNSKLMGGYRATPGLYWLTLAGGEPQFVLKDGEAPRFSPDGARIYFATESYPSDTMVTRLESVDLSGRGRKTHAEAVGPDTSDVRTSPDLKWIAFKHEQEYYIARSLPGKTQSLTPETATKVSVNGGYALTWFHDSKTAYWTLGPAVHNVAVDRLAPAPKPAAVVNLEVNGDVPQGTIAFVGGRVITMRGEEVIERGTVVVSGNKIVAVGPEGSVDVPVGAKVIDTRGKTVMPGLVDMHGHIECCYYGGLMPQKQPSLYAALAYGVTTNFDPYTSELPAFESSELQKVGATVAPRLIYVGRVVYGRSNKDDKAYVSIKILDDARSLMARKVALGGTVIKSYKQPARHQRQQLIKAGREAGVMVDVEGESHFPFNLSMILDGHMNLEHNLPVANYYDDIVQLFAHSKTSNTPTLIVTFGEMMGENYYYQHTRPWEEPKVKLYVQETTSGYSPLRTPYSAPPYVRAMTTIHAADEIYDIGFRAVARSTKKLDDAGVTINVGSHGQIYGLAMHWEMWLMAQGGMSNHRILKAATWNGAKTLALDAQIGSLEVGKLADVIVLDRNPLDDIKNSNTVRYTMVNGRLYDSLPMNEIGNTDRPRTKFYWELPDYKGIDWNESWSGQ